MEPPVYLANGHETRSTMNSNEMGRGGPGQNPERGTGKGVSGRAFFSVRPH